MASVIALEASLMTAMREVLLAKRVIGGRRGFFLS